MGRARFACGQESLSIVGDDASRNTQPSSCSWRKEKDGGGATLVLNGHGPEEMHLIPSHTRVEKYKANVEIWVVPNDHAAILH